MAQSQANLFLSWAQAALRQYPLREPSLRFLGHSDNLTFRVEGPGGALYLLRLHRPALKIWAGMRQLPEVIASELAWMEALAEDGGFTVQRPVHTCQGDLVASVDTGDTKPLPATLLNWLDGEHFSPSAPDATLVIERFGALVARLHDFSTRWVPPPGFTRPQYDYQHFHRLFARLLRGADLGVFSEDVYRTLHAATQEILAEMNALPDDAGSWGAIHADLHMGNFLVRDGQVIPIDFSFCGMGHYLFDLSVSLAGGLNAALRPVFLRGYRSVRALPAEALRPVDAYALAGRLSYYAYQIDNPAERTWLQRRIPEVAKTDCARFLQGERIMTIDD